MPTPALNIPVRVNLDEFKKGMKDTSALAGTATKQIAKHFIDLNATTLATSGAAGSAALGFRSVLGVLGPLGVAVGATAGLFKLMATATDLAKERIEDFYQTSEKAGKAGVSTDFFQRMSKSGEGLKLTIDDVNAGLDRFAAKSQGALGGSALEKAIAALVKDGNFTGNANVAAVSAATGNEAKLRATVALITEAMEKGERLAAIDLSEKAFGSKITDSLRANSTYLQEMLANADKIAASQIISPDEIARAIDLKKRLEDAQKILTERFKPIQDDLAKLGTNYHESWVNIYQNMASAVSVANQLYAALKEIPEIFARAGNAPFWSKLIEYLKARGLTDDSGLMEVGGTGVAATVASSPANRELAAMLGNPNAVRQAMRDAIDAQTKVRGDLSKAPPPTPKAAETRDPFEAALEQGDRRIAIVKAETATIGQNSEARERAKLVANLEEAAKRANAAAGEQLYGVTEKTNPKIGEQADKMLAAAAAARQQQDAFQGLQDGLRFAGGQIIDVLDRIGQKGSNFGDIMRDVLRNLQRQLLTAAITGEGAFGKMFGMGGTGSGMGGIMGGIGKMLGFAEGGYVSGPGSGKSDSVPARLSNGEFVIRASQTAKHLPLLRAINDNAIPRFANGGLVGSQPASAAPMMSSGQTIIAPSIAVTVQGSAGQSPGDHAAMGENIAKAANASIRKIVADELRTQSRPGGINAKR